MQRVHAAVLALAQREGPTALTMEGIAAQAGVGKQTLYRSWPSVTAILFDALAGSDADAEQPPTPPSVADTLRAAIDEISSEPRCSLLRLLAASIQTDEDVAREFHERLLTPQLAQLRALVGEAGARDPVRTTELLLAPVFYRWFMRLPQFGDDEIDGLVRAVLAGDAQADQATPPGG